MYLVWDNLEIASLTKTFRILFSQIYLTLLLISYSQGALLC